MKSADVKSALFFWPYYILLRKIEIILNAEDCKSKIAGLQILRNTNETFILSSRVPRFAGCAILRRTKNIPSPSAWQNFQFDDAGLQILRSTH